MPTKNKRKGARKSPPKNERPPKRTTEPAGELLSGGRFPIVGVGASAGGLAAFEALFAHIPAKAQAALAFVIVQHLDPDHKSILTELIRRYAPMRVFEIIDGMTVEPNATYIIPPRKDLSLVDGVLRLGDPSERRGQRLPIDSFFRSLANDRGEQAIGIILSGTGTDGTLGLRAIKEAGGMAMVQDPRSAEYDGMPRSAITSGLADYILPPEEMPAQLVSYLLQFSPPKEAANASLPGEVSGWINRILAFLRAHTGHDFSNYKQNTIRRRVERRMAVNQISSIDKYVRLLRQNPAETDTLFRELLIGVTGFFRDPPAFEAVRDLALAPLLAGRVPGLPIRVWVPGCSTGEEAYSLAMLIHEAAEKLGREFVVQIFATDIDHDSIEKARAAVYPANIAADVSPERLARFFTHEEKDFYRITKTLRDQVVFAEQDVIKDPPFSKLDLISCRNLLIYMEPVLQRRLIPLFHYALAPGGFLFLGNSESIGEFPNFFGVVDRKWKLYRRKEIGLPAAVSIKMPAPNAPTRAQAPDGQETPKDKRASLREVTERVLLRNYAPASVTVNERGDILYVHGRSGRYLELAAGEASLNLVRAAREGLKVELANALRKVMAERSPVHYEGLEVRMNGDFATVDVTAELADPAGNIIVVTFREAPTLPAARRPKPDSGKKAGDGGADGDEKDRQIAALERELRIKAETLQTTVEELETSNEELKSTNEELQSTNEELETSKEELQSVNEELVTVNTELQQKMEGLSQANNDMNNLLAGTGIGMLFVDHQLRIQRFTPATTQIINLIQTDVGRPASDLVSNLAGYDRLADDVKSVLDTLIPREAEVQTRDGHWYLMRILPYRTVENVIEGAVLTFVDIAGQKRAEEQLRKLGGELEARVRDRVAELERLNEDLKREVRERAEADSRRMKEIAALFRLQEASIGGAGDGAREKLLESSLEAGMELSHADRGMLHLYDEASHSLRLATSRGFAPPLPARLKTIGGDGGALGVEALRKAGRIVLEDIASRPERDGPPDLAALRAAGVGAAQFSPVLGREGRLLAVISTQWNEPHRPEEGALRLLDLLVFQLAALLEGAKAGTKAK